MSFELRRPNDPLFVFNIAKKKCLKSQVTVFLPSFFLNSQKVLFLNLFLPEYSRLALLKKHYGFLTNICAILMFQTLTLIVASGFPAVTSTLEKEQHRIPSYRNEARVLIKTNGITVIS